MTKIGDIKEEIFSKLKENNRWPNIVEIVEGDVDVDRSEPSFNSSKVWDIDIATKRFDIINAFIYNQGFNEKASQICYTSLLTVPPKDNQKAYKQLIVEGYGNAPEDKERLIVEKLNSVCDKKSDFVSYPMITNKIMNWVNRNEKDNIKCAFSVIGTNTKLRNHKVLGVVVPIGAVTIKFCITISLFGSGENHYLLSNNKDASDAGSFIIHTYFVESSLSLNPTDSYELRSD